MPTRYVIQIYLVCVHNIFLNNAFYHLVLIRILWGNFSVYQVCLQNHSVSQLTFIISFFFSDIDEAVWNLQEDICTTPSIILLVAVRTSQEKEAEFFYFKGRARKMANVHHLKEKRKRTLAFIIFFFAGSFFMFM